LVADAFGFADVQIRFWGQRSRSQQGEKNWVNTISDKTMKGISPKFWSQMYLGS